MAELNFLCKKCEEVFECDVGKIAFGDRLSFQKRIVCPNCGSLSINEIELTEYGQTQVAEYFMPKQE